MTQEQLVNLVIAVLGLLAISTLVIYVTLNIKKQKKTVKANQKVKQSTKGDNSPAINIGHNIEK
jgi:TctA family transporter